jgi:hypothetical protein
MSDYQMASTPEFADVQQELEPDAMIEVPVRVVDIGAVQVHQLPARDAVMRGITIPPDRSVIQIVGGDLRRSRLLIWAQGEADGDIIQLGVDKNEVESGTGAHMIAIAPGTLAPSRVIEMRHTRPVWVINPGTNPVILSFLAEYWAD